MLEHCQTSSGSGFHRKQMEEIAVNRVASFLGGTLRLSLLALRSNFYSHKT